MSCEVTALNISNKDKTNNKSQISHSDSRNHMESRLICSHNEFCCNVEEHHDIRVVYECLSLHEFYLFERLGALRITLLNAKSSPYILQLHFINFCGETRNVGDVQ